MPDSNLHELLVHELKDVYNAEKQLIQALPKMAKAADSDELREAFAGHLEETRGHVKRLEGIFKDLEETTGRKKCKGMEGLIEEGSEAIEEHDAGPGRDALLIAGAQKVEHYEISTYGTIRAWAEELGLDDVVETIGETLDEESAANEKLTDIAEGGVLSESVNAEAATQAK